MPLYFFHVRQRDVLFEDKRGGEFSDLRAAWDWALHDVREMIADGALEGPIEEQWIEIHDVAGTVVATVPFARALPVH